MSRQPTHDVYIIGPNTAVKAREALAKSLDRLVEFKGSEADLRAVVAVFEANGREEQADLCRRWLPEREEVTRG